VALSLEYVAKETGNNLRRNVLMTTGAILCVAVSLTIVGIALVLKQGVSRATVQWRNGVDMSIFMNAAATPEQTAAIKTQLDGLTGTEIKRYSYCDQSCAYKEFRTMFANTPDFTQSVSQSDLPPSFRVVPVHPELIEQIGNKFSSQPGVRDVEYAKDAIKGLLTVTHYAQVAFLTLAAILLVLAVLLIVNTIRMAIFSRRREVAVMKLVGATNWFIRVPFMTEGMIQGLAGATVAFVVVYVLRNVVFDLVKKQSIFNNLIASTHDVIGTGIAILIVGAVVGAGGSAAAVSRFLDV
jgi:cell division transport system permease protein